MVELFLLIVSLKSEAVVFQFSTLLQRMECRFELLPLIPLKQGKEEDKKTIDTEKPKMNRLEANISGKPGKNPT